MTGEPAVPSDGLTDRPADAPPRSGGGIVLAGLNARYTHTCLAIRDLKRYLLARWPAAPAITLLEPTINDPRDMILHRLYQQQARLYGFSCAIWNIGLVAWLSSQLKKILPDAIIVWGGPEVSENAAEQLGRHPAVDLIVSGEGEEAFYQLVRILFDPGWPGDLAAVPGLAWRSGGQVRENPAGEPLKPADWEFPYTAAELAGLPDRIIYYETSRGCPYRCSYCLSALERTVRFRPLPQVQAELDLLLQANPLQVKLVDRTFNSRPERAATLWQYLLDHRPAGSRTCFHFEIRGDLIDAAAIALLAQAPPGYFQFEIGVQTIQPHVLQAIGRSFLPDELHASVVALHQAGRIHLHLDLIAGLPGESATQFAESFNWVYQLRPHTLQLGFLKILPGCPLAATARADGYAWQDEPPYEVLYSDAMCYDDLIRLKRVAHILDLYYNSGYFPRSLAWLASRWPDPFAFYAALAAWPGLAAFWDRAPGLTERFRQLAGFADALLWDVEQARQDGAADPAWLREAWRGLLRADYLDTGQKDDPECLGFGSGLPSAARSDTADPENKALAARDTAWLRQQIKRQYPGCRRVRLERYVFDWQAFQASGDLRPGDCLAAYDISGTRPALLDIFPADKLY
jgi:radical SAM superfamily enzyme YgiQ (UPF0313 family)